MRQLIDAGDGLPVVAIVGGGASGALTALQLLRQAARHRLALHIALIDRHDRHGLGQAYSTVSDAHLLNTIAGQMSALPDDPDHLIRWAGVAKETFLPRWIYGRYLRDALAEAEAQAPPGARLARIRADITSVVRRDRPDGVRLDGGRLDGVRLDGPDGWLDADLAVLAIGNLPGGLPFAAPVSHRVIGDPWYPGALDVVTDGEPVLIVGTGLTMIDLATTISEQSPGSVIYAVSRHGLLPRPHPSVPACGRSVSLPAVSADACPVRLAALMSDVRTAVAADPQRWPEVMAAIRHRSPALWRDLTDSDKRLFLRRLARYWEVHRHLVPPATMRTIDALAASGRLRVLTGRVTEAVAADGRFRVGIVRDSASREVSAGWIISASGAPADIADTRDPLLAGLFASGLARPDPLRLGLDATPEGAVIDQSGRASDTLLTLGPPLRGILYETTAIPEIRTQAAELANRIASHPSVALTALAAR